MLREEISWSAGEVQQDLTNLDSKNMTFAYNMATIQSNLTRE
jgi:hypothetical protein